MTPEDIKLAALLFSEAKPQSKLNEVPFAPGDPRGPFFRSMVDFWLYLLKRSEPEYEALYREL